MKGNSTYPTTAFLLAVILCAASCQYDEILEPSQEKATFTIVGNPVEVHLGITVNDLEIGVGTRAEEPTTYDMENVEEERHVDDLWIFEYSQTTKELIYPPTYLTISKQEELADIKMTLSDNNGNPVTIYVVANSGSGVEENGKNWVVEEAVGTDITYTGFMTIADLEANALPTPHPQRMLWNVEEGKYVIQSYDASIIDTISIPMSGSVEEMTVAKDAELSVPVDRMFAKLLLAVDLSDFDDYPDQSVDLTALDIGNIPEYCRVGTLWDNDKTDTAKPGDYSECRQWIQRRFTGDGTITDDVGNEIYPFIIYIPENIQGENSNVDATDKADNAPIPEGSTSTYALNTEASVTVTLQDGSVIGPYTYTAYPGGNGDTNFNVRRNCVYRVNLIISYPVSLDAVPSANCVVCLSGQTTTFFPYCREETGGGYNFTDYLDAYDETGAKKIDHIGVVWQSKTETGSSARKGFLGDNSDDSLVWIDELGNGEAEAEYLRKIYVAVPEGERGNALVAAYNSDGDIIWSWHIWARTPDTDPTSVGTQLYYTYYWDENGIYGKDSGVARVAGYTIMNCNLGAMQDEPTNGDLSARATVAPTFGLMYEWGRKDPFPSYNRIGGNSNGVFVEYGDYVTWDGNYYCDGEDNEIAIANYERTSANELFYSLPGKDRPTTFDEAIRQSIQNPTAYLCGSNEAKAYDGSELGTGSGDFPDEDRILAFQTNFPEPHDGNWLYDETTNHYNRLWGGLDPELDNVSKKFDTGYTCVLGDVHLYDDYGEKSIFDPCPYGWRVSPPDLWLGFTDDGMNPDDRTHVNYCEEKTGDSLYGMYMYMTGWREGNMSFFPAQGTRQPNGAAYKIGNCGNYHNATADSGGRVNIMHIHNSDSSFKIFENTQPAYYLKSVASPVRCVRTATVVQQ